MMTLCSKTPNDPYYTDGRQWAVDKIDLPEAWDITTGSLYVTVAVIDSGIYGNHPEMSGRIKVSQCQDFTSGYGLPTGMSTDDNGHGTFVAAIIGAAGDNEEGGVGVCWNVYLASLKAFNSAGNGYSSHVAMAINFAEAQGIPIINLSARWYDGNERYDYALNTVINSYSGLFVCIAGNEGLDNDVVTVYPTNYNCSNMIVVGASDENDEKCLFSNYGQTSVDIFAPGIDIYSTTRAGYEYKSGTSYAAPYVAGVAALLLVKYPYLTTAELKQTILENVDIVYDSDGNSVFGDLCTSGGWLNAYKALSNRKHTHTYTYESVGIYEGHNCVCTACGSTTRERHTWNTTGSLHRCIKCGLESSYRPYANNNLSDE